VRKRIYILLIAIVVLGLSACSNNSEEDLQSKKWNVDATNGESYTAEFGKDTVSFKMGSLTRGFTYKISDDEISLEANGEEPIVFEVEKDGDEYFFKATTEAIRDQFGDLTLSPNKD